MFVAIVVVIVGIGAHTRFFWSQHNSRHCKEKYAREINNNIAASLSRDGDVAYGVYIEEGE